jgi:hypothetical protein
MKKIKVLCPATVATGGPELLHQFCYEARKLGYYSCMVYYSDDVNKLKNPVAKQYEHYQNPYEIELVDDDSIFIIPETYPIALTKIKKGIKAFWWLSVDNYLTQFNLFHGHDLSHSIVAPLLKKLKIAMGRAFDVTDFDVDFHLVQSYYAKNYCETLGISSDKIFYLSDYLNDSYIANAQSNQECEKENYVLYNPKKGFEFTKQIIKFAPSIKWKPIVNMSYDQVVELMQKSKVYIDFGNHPGKDRLPREACINGCCVITGRRGAAAFQQDVNIPQDYKFDDKISSIPDIINKIEYIFDNYQTAYLDFNEYRNMINQEHKYFLRDLSNVCKILNEK